MAAGNIVSAVGSLQYAGASISGGTSKGLLNIFTDISGAAPSSGDQMYPVYTSPDAYYYVAAGAYVGGYNINRNDPVGAAAWGNIVTSGGQFNLNDFHGYCHWPLDNYFAIRVNNNTPDDVDVLIETPGPPAAIICHTTVPSATMFDPFSGTASTYASGPGTSGAFSRSIINSPWDIKFTLINISQIQPSNVTITVTDYYDGSTFYTNNLTLDPGTGWAASDNWSNRYWWVPAIDININ